jgi:hypothetical protein
MRKTTVKKQLECVLTNDEMLSYSKEMSKYISEQMQAEGNQKAYVSQMKAIIEEAKSHINSLNLKIGTGREFREVECRVFYDWDKKTKQYFRLDTGDLCGDDIITHDEIQEEMDFQKKEIQKTELIHMEQEEKQEEKQKGKKKSKKEGKNDAA